MSICLKHGKTTSSINYFWIINSIQAVALFWSQKNIQNNSPDNAPYIAVETRREWSHLYEPCASPCVPVDTHPLSKDSDFLAALHRVTSLFPRGRWCPSKLRTVRGNLCYQNWYSGYGSKPKVSLLGWLPSFRSLSQMNKCFWVFTRVSGFPSITTYPAVSPTGPVSNAPRKQVCCSKPLAISEDVKDMKAVKRRHVVLKTCLIYMGDLYWKILYFSGSQVSFPPRSTKYERFQGVSNKKDVKQC